MTEYTRNPNTACSVCGEKIYRRPAEIKRAKNGLFCGMVCYGKSQRKEHPCLVCGAPILAGSNKKTCSRSCANTYRAGIKYKIGRPKDKAVNALALKKRLAKKRGRTCERCDYNTYKILQVHHKDRNRDNNTLKNLELLCPNCHAEEHYLKKS